MLTTALALASSQFLLGTGPDAAFDHEATATSLVQGLAAGHPERVTHHFDARMRSLMSEDKLGAVWANLEQTLGAFVRVEESAVSTAGGFDAVSVRCEMKDSTLDVQLVFDERGRISGLFFEPKDDGSEEGWRPPPYASTDEIIEEPLFVEDPALVELILTRPRRPAERLPVLVIGPAPMTADLGPRANRLRPHKDLALGLATLGVAVVRFEPKSPDSRAASHAALRAIFEHEGVDPDRIAFAAWQEDALPTEPLLMGRVAAVVWPRGVAPSEFGPVRASAKTWRVLAFQAQAAAKKRLPPAAGLQIESYPELDANLTKAGQAHVHPEVVEDIASFLFRLPAK